MKDYNVWIEGYSFTGGQDQAEFLGTYKAISFKSACERAMNFKDYDLRYYNNERNSHWGCKFYETEIEARKNFG